MMFSFSSCSTRRSKIRRSVISELEASEFTIGLRNLASPILVSTKIFERPDCNADWLP